MEYLVKENSKVKKKIRMINELIGYYLILSFKFVLLFFLYNY